MARRFVRSSLSAAALLLGLAPAAFAQMPDKPSAHLRAAVSDYDAELARQCPDKRLDLLSPADLSFAIETFDGFSPTEAAIAKSGADRTCVDAIAGVTCINMAMIQSAHRDHRMRAFAAHVCALPKTCTSQSVCSSAKP